MPMYPANFDHQYLSIGTQYYLAGRRAFFIGSIYVAGNLHHHGFEMVLKSSLAQDLPDEELRRKFRHRLKKLWREFKEKSGVMSTPVYDKIISQLDKWEEVRYPRTSPISLSLLASSGEKPEASPLDGLFEQEPRKYVLNLEDLDELFAFLVLTLPLLPDGFRE